MRTLFLSRGLFLASLVSATTLSHVSNKTVNAIGTACACSKLASLYPNDLVTSESASYTTANLETWDIRTVLSPSCILLPKDAEQVASAVGIFSDCDAEFAIRGGGHMNYPGSNNINGGVLIALNQLTHLEVLEEQAIEVGPGNRWVDVYGALQPHGRYAIGGRLKTIGVPGLTLIGGVHYFINKYGFAMDNVLSYDIVLGNGTQVIANETSNSDLFWALKGGANNFGVVTKFTLKTFDMPLISTTIQLYNESGIEGYIKAACDYAVANDEKIASGSVLSIDYNATAKHVTAQLLGVQEGIESPPSRFANFSAIPATTRLFNVTTTTQWHDQFDTPNQIFRIQFGHHTIKPNFERLFEMYRQWKSAVDDIADVEGLFPTFVLNVAPKSAAAVAKNNSIGNVWGLNDSESYIWWQLATSWASEDDDLRMTSWTKSLLDQFHTVNQAKDLATDFVYMGDAAEFQNPYRGFAAENVARMVRIRDEYDAGRVFTKLNWGGFKLGYGNGQ